MRTLRAVNPTAAFIALGVTTAFVYASIVSLYPLLAYRAATSAYDLEQLSSGRAWAAGLYVRGLLIAFAAFAAAFFLVPRLRRPLGAVVGFGLLFALILIWIYPVTAIDVFYYVLQGRQEVTLRAQSTLGACQPGARGPVGPLRRRVECISVALWPALGSLVRAGRPLGLCGRGGWRACLQSHCTGRLSVLYARPHLGHGPQR